VACPHCGLIAKADAEQRRTATLLGKVDGCVEGRAIVRIETSHDEPKPASQR
jgi:hypothetical protein